MGKSKKNLGDYGENLAAHFLKAKGYEIIDNHFCLRGGEIDLIAQNENELVFVEVKTRLNTNFGYASDCVPPYKIKKLMYSAEKYLSQKQLKPENYRIDVVGIDYDHGKLEIEHIVDALI